MKAFNTILAELLRAETREGGAPVQVFVAVDDTGARKAVTYIVAAGGIDPVDSGLLSNSRFLELVGKMNICFGFFLGWGTSTAPAWIKGADASRAK